MGATLTLFRIRGIPVQVHASWLVIYGLIAWTLAAGYFPYALPGLPRGTHWLSGLLAALLLFLSVFLHELSHALAARRHDLPVSSITLHIFGGVSHLGRQPDRPAAELIIAIVGPLTSFAIAGGVAALAALAPSDPVGSAVMQYLVLVNLTLGLFNVVPGLPLDGGHVMRAMLWKATGDFAWASRMASRSGEASAFFIIGLGVWRAVVGEFLGGLWFVVIGFVLHQAAAASYRQLVVRRALAPCPVGNAMARDVVHVPPDVSVATLVDDYFWRHHVTSFPVVERDRVLGIVSIHDLSRVAQGDWPTTAVRDLMRPLTRELTASPRDSLWEAFERAARNGVGRLAVVEDQRLVGYLSLRDMTHVLAVATAAGPDPLMVSTHRPAPDSG